MTVSFSINHVNNASKVVSAGEALF